jgi:dihydropteroate synthase
MTQARVLKVDDIRREMSKIGVDPCGIKLMSGKAVFRVIKLEEVDHRAANILKQEMLSLDGEAACSRDVMALKKGRASVLLFGTDAQLRKLILKLSYQPFGLKNIALQIKKLIDLSSRPAARPRLMGILNLTPDSFSDGGRFLDMASACERALVMEAEGADILDIGGESSRPGSLPVSPKEELRRVLPVLKELKNKIRIPISIDTYKAVVAEACLEQGASIINDISALRADREMVKLAARRKVKVILMHMQGKPRRMQAAPHYQDVVSEIYDFLGERIAWAEEHGVKKDNIIIDPGIGFGKTLEHNCEILRKLCEFKSLGCPLLLGGSRKSMIGKILNREPGDRLSGSLAVAAWGLQNGADILRVHDVKETRELLRVLTAIKNN